MPKKTRATGDLRSRIIGTIQRIPRGKVATYGGVAKAAGLPRGARMVAKVLCRSVGLPWQRVLGAGGEIKLKGDSAFEQRFRLQSEGVTFRGRRVDLTKHEFNFGKKSKAGRPARKKTGSRSQSRPVRS